MMTRNLQKHLLPFVFICLLSTQSLFAQFRSESGSSKLVLGFGGGYNIATADLSGYNFVIDRYNFNRQGSTQQLAGSSTLAGFTGSLSLYGNMGASGRKFLFQLQYAERSTPVSSAPDPFIVGGNNNIKTKFRMHNFSFGAGAMPLLSKWIDIGVGASLDASWVSMMYAAGQENLRTLQDQWLWGATAYGMIFVNFGEKAPFSIGIRPFFQYQFSQADASPLNRVLNPTTFSLDDPAKAKWNVWNAGVEVKFVITPVKFNYY